MHQIEKQNFSGIRLLDAAGYFNALIKEGYGLSLLKSGQLEATQYQLIQLLTNQFNRWTGGQSSSVPVERGQKIQQSVFYTIGYYLKSLPDNDSAMEALKADPLQLLFEKGKIRITEDKREAEKLLHLIRNDRFHTDVIAYNDTLNEGLSMFFKSYDIDFEAQETPGSIDYPLGKDIMDFTGIEYIYEYIKKLQLENEFCGYFSKEEVDSLLRGYDRQYKELLFNIYDLVLINAVGRSLLGDMISGPDASGGCGGGTLHISDHDRQYLQQKLAPLPQHEVDKLADQAVSGLCESLSLSDTPLAAYIRVSSVNLKARLQNALKSDGLKGLFLNTEEEVAKPSVLFEDKAMLDPDSFRRLADEIRECRFAADKILILRKAEPGITDLTDLLEGDCFFGEEYLEVFDSLEDIQLALLIKKLPLDPADSGFLAEDNSREWQSSLNSYLTGMEPGRKAAFLSLARRFEADSLF